MGHKPDDHEEQTRQFQYYDGIVDALLEAGVQPWITLYHWDLPQALQNKGGWLNEDTARAFGLYARAAAEHFKGRVKHWLTINEPQCFIGMGYGSGQHAPGLRLRAEDQMLCWQNVLLGHTLAAQALREADSGNLVGLASCGGVCYPDSDLTEDIAAARQQIFAYPNGFHGFSHHHLLDPLCLGNSDGKPDFIGLNIYSGNRIRQSADGPEEAPYPTGGPRTAFGWPVTPEALEWGPRFIGERYNLPMYISENGLSCRDWAALGGKVHDPGRIDLPALVLLIPRQRGATTKAAGKPLMDEYWLRSAVRKRLEIMRHLFVLEKVTSLCVVICFPLLILQERRPLVCTLSSLFVQTVLLSAW